MTQEKKIFFYTNWHAILEHPNSIDISVIMEGVFHTDERVSSKACDALRRRHSLNGAESYIQRLVKHKRPSVRRTAVEILPRFPRSLAVEHCVTMALSDGDIEVCEVAFQASLRLLEEADETTKVTLTEILSTAARNGDALTLFLVGALNSNREEIRLLIAKHLYFWLFHARPSDYCMAVERLSKDSSEQVRVSVIRDLAYMSNRDSYLPHDAADEKMVNQILHFLQDALEDKSDEVRECAVEGLSRLNTWKATPAALSALTIALEDPMLRIRLQAAAALSEAGLEPLNEGQTIIFRAANLIFTRNETIPQSKPLQARTDSKAADVLIGLFDDPKTPHHLSAAQILSEIADRTHLDLLRDIAARVREPEIKFWLQKAIQRLDPTNFIADILSRCKADDARIRREAAIRLGEVQSSNVVQALLEMLGDSDEFVRVNAASSLGKVGDSSIVNAIEQGKATVSQDVQWYFDKAIKCIHQRHDKD